ncbi:hypothetical protein [Microbacterium testaceum]|uniref:hypothetical protein n=1 Tax=Microbacterium testaceum TaxID=2033 RepID=UPI00187BE7D0|nr:hypothetical protein [Microbacterium testaceum]
MTPEVVVLVQLGTAGVAALTSLINLVLVFAKRKLDPTATQLLSDQFKEISRTNKRNDAYLKSLMTLVNKRLGSVDKALTRLKSPTA